MAGSNLYIFEAGNIFFSDIPNESNHLELSEIKLPDMEYQVEGHAPGGGVMGINIAMPMVTALVGSCKLKGINPDRLKLFGIGGVARRNITVYGVIRDKRENKQTELKAVMNCCIHNISGTAWTRGNGMDHDLKFSDMIRYRLDMDAKPVWEIDGFTNTFKIGGIAQNDQSNRILRVPAVA
jgi:P2 family phage contractile tail tube protein